MNLIGLIVIVVLFQFYTKIVCEPQPYALIEEPRVGTWGFDGTVQFCLVKPTARMENKFFEFLREGFLNGPLKGWLLPPTKLNFNLIKSKYLGVFGVLLVLRTQSDDFDEDLLDELDYYLSSNDMEDQLIRCLGKKEDSDIKKFGPFYGDRDARWYDVPPMADSSSAAITEQESPLSKNKIEITKYAVPELALLSAPKQLKFFKGTAKTTYYNWQDAGKGCTVYLVDTGCDLNHHEFENVTYKDWIETTAYPREIGSDALEQNNHGSFMAAKMFGKRTGVARSIDLIVAPAIDRDGELTFYTILDALLKVYDHIKTNNSKRPCIINFSLASGSIYYDVVENIWRELMLEFRALGNVIISTVAGNGHPTEPIVEYPAVLGLEKEFSNLVVSGGADPATYTNLLQFDPNIVNFVFAPSKVYSIAWKNPFLPISEVALRDAYSYRSDGGTSIATATTTGILAGYISRNLKSKTVVNDTIKSIKRKSFKRNSDPISVPIISNGITIDQWPKADQKAVGYNIGKKCLNKIGCAIS
ncbi:hypothetical protein TWF694_011173 [Orbilia ellipsospora]|uniref:Peptidase S8/S53 domain-containing protein n=1 Tax=Orbilia ellipsospora TaxID=2528407 RepID=A0AAV9X970_9PEZI